MVTAALPAAPAPWGLIRRIRDSAPRLRLQVERLPGSLIVIPSKGQDVSTGRLSPAQTRWLDIVRAIDELGCVPFDGPRLMLVVLKRMDGWSFEQVGRLAHRRRQDVSDDWDEAWRWLCDPCGGRLLTERAWQRGIEEEP